MLDVAIGLVVYGKRLNMMTKETRPEVAEFVQSILDVFKVFTELRMSYSFHKLIQSQAWHTNLEGWRKNFEFNAVLVAELQERLMARMNGQADGSEGNYYVTSLLEQLFADSQQSVQEVVLTAMDMFSAGMETVSEIKSFTETCISFVLLHVGQLFSYMGFVLPSKKSRNSRPNF